MVATLTLVQDVTANASLLTLLAGPRWAIGTRDLRAARTSRHRPVRRPRPGLLRRRTRRARRRGRRGSDPAEVASLGDALESPGELDYSPEARARFALLAAELRRLRAAVGEPILDLVRRIIDTCGIDVELASSASPAASARRDNLDLFVQAVSEFQAVDGAGHAGGPARLARGRGLLRPGPRRRDPFRGRLRQAPHGPPRQGPGVGRRVHPGRDRAEVPHRPHPLHLADRAVRDAGEPPRRRARPSGAGRAHPRRDQGVHRRDQGARAHRGAAARRTSPGPARDTGSGSPAGASRPRSRRAAARRSTSRPRSVRWPTGASCPSRGASGPTRTSPTPTPPSTPTCRGRCPTRRPRSRGVTRQRPWSPRQPRRWRPAHPGSTRPTTCSYSVASRSGTTS